MSIYIKGDVQDLHQVVLKSILLANEKAYAYEIWTVNRTRGKQNVKVSTFPIFVLIF